MSRPVKLRVDWSRCDGLGLCPLWAPELIQSDEWGYPVVAKDAVPPERLPEAREAIRACPRMALALVRARV